MIKLIKKFLYFGIVFLMFFLTTAYSMEKSNLNSPSRNNRENTNVLSGELTIYDIIGQYVREPAANNWHKGTISIDDDYLRWENEAGVSWALLPDLENDKLLTNEECPYYESSNGDAFILEIQQNSEGFAEVNGFRFLGELYVREIQNNCTAPEIIVTGTSTNNISLQWNDAGANSYNIYYKEPNVGSWTNAASGLTGTNYVIHGLTASTIYNFAVLSVCPDGTSPYNIITAETTGEAEEQIVCDKNLEPTGNGQHQWGSSYADWYNNTWGIVFEQTIILEQVAPNSFHTNTFSLSDASGGYIGLQTHGINYDGSIETNVRFSIWNTIEAEGDQCSPFGGEGIGQTCVINPLKLSLGVYYTIRVERLNTESDGTWWLGSVLNVLSGDTYVIGKIKVPHAGNDRLIRAGGNFSEYFGPKAEDCKSVPQSIVSWQTPRVTEENGNSVISKFRSFSKANPDQPCSDAGVEASGEIINSNGTTLYRMINGTIPMCWLEYID